MLYRISTFSIFVFLLMFFTTAVNANMSVNIDNVKIEKVLQEPQLENHAQVMESGNVDLLPGAKISEFVARTPINDQKPSEKTLTFLSYDHQHIYAMFLCYDSEPEKIRGTLSNRDSFPGIEDSIALHLITFPKSQQMHGFQVNSAGSRIDGSYNLSSGWDLSSDPIWESTAQLTNNGYVVKVKIPISSLRFPPGEVQNWNFFAYRGIPRKNENLYFPAFSSDISNRFVQAGTLEGIKLARKAIKMEFTPFVTSVNNENKQATQNDNGSWESNNDNNIGLDAKFIFDDRIVADLTLNPDFSQVESDEPQVITNQRFAVYFPEKRPFFIENSSYFETPLNLLFTRKIANPSAGLRVTGQVGDWSMAGMAIDDENINDSGDDAKLYVTNIRKSLHQDSFIGAFISDYSNSDVDSTNLSVQGRYRLTENWLIDSQLAFMDETNATDALDGEAFYITAARQDEQWNYKIQGKYISDNFDSRVGFIARTGIKEVDQNISYRQLAETDWIIAYKYGLISNYVWNNDNDILDEHNQLQFNMELSGQTFLNVNLNNKSERLGALDYTSLNTLTNFEQDYIDLGIESALLPQLDFSIKYSAGDAINYQPAEGLQPEVGDFDQWVSSMTYTVGPQLKLQLQYIGNTLDTKDSAEVFSSKQTRFKAVYQFDQFWSLRFIVDKQDISTNSLYSSLVEKNTVVADVLLKWDLLAGTAMYLGYGSLKDEYHNIQSIHYIQNKGKSIYLKFNYRFNY